LFHARKLALAAAVAAPLALTAAAPAVADRPDQAGPEVQTYTADLTSLNRSGASGTATLTLERNRLTVTINAEGVEADKLHPQHIHGFDDASTNSVCPSTGAADDIAGSPEEAAEPDEFISVEEGLPAYGKIQLPLQPFPKPDTTSYTFTQTYSGKDLAGLQPIKKTLQNRVIVVHGDTLDNGTYVPTLPIACGQIELS
jgi:hypothetical protein